MVPRAPTDRWRGLAGRPAGLSWRSSVGVCSREHSPPRADTPAVRCGPTRTVAPTGPADPTDQVPQGPSGRSLVVTEAPTDRWRGPAERSAGGQLAVSGGIVVAEAHPTERGGLVGRSADGRRSECGHGGTEDRWRGLAGRSAGLSWRSSVRVWSRAYIPPRAARGRSRHSPRTPPALPHMTEHLFYPSPTGYPHAIPRASTRSSTRVGRCMPHATTSRGAAPRRPPTSCVGPLDTAPHDTHNGPSGPSVGTGSCPPPDTRRSRQQRSGSPGRRPTRSASGIGAGVRPESGRIGRWEQHTGVGVSNNAVPTGRKRTP